MSACRFVASDRPRVIAGRHAAPCACDGESGCLECPQTHCLMCNKDHARAICTHCLADAREDLHAIIQLSGNLAGEAIIQGVVSQALMLAGPVADPEGWRHRALSAMVGRIDAAYLEDCRDERHPLWTLGTWEQIWREFLDHFTEAPITVLSAAQYLDMQMGYMADQLDPAFDEFARELSSCRTYLEDVLRDGIREERTRVPCVDCGARLVKVFAQKAADDRWECRTRSCGRTYNAEEYARASHYHLSDDRADKFVKVSEALGMIDRPEVTLRAWMANGSVKTDRDARTGGLLVWWPDVRDMHRNTPTRKRRSA